MGESPINAGGAGEDLRLTDRLLLARWLPWTIPAVLAALGLGYETIEHVVHLSLGELPNFGFEVLLFVVAGPLAVFAALTYMRQLLRGRFEAAQEMAALNRDLERMVADRTAHLERAQREVMQQAEQLEAANAELRRLDTLKSDFVSLVSHELRGPLTTLSGAIEFIAQDAASLPPASQRTLDILAGESTRLRTLVESILDVSRIEAGHLQLTVGPVSLEALTRRCLASVNGGELRHRTVFHATGQLPPAWADEIYLEEVLRNVLANASKYSTPGTPVTVEAGPAGGTITISVSNRGPAIAPEHQRRLFEPFYRGGSNGQRASGYGLGLYFARRLIEVQGGYIAVRSPAFDDGGPPGATFTITIPMAPEEAP